MDRELTWLDIVQPDARQPQYLESQEVEKKRIYSYLEYCKKKGSNPDSFYNYQNFMKQRLNHHVDTVFE